MRYFAIALLFSLHPLCAFSLTSGSCQEEERTDYWAQRPAGFVKDPWESRTPSSQASDAALKICNELSEAEAKERCRVGIRDAKLSPGAVGYCASLPRVSERGDCVLGFRDVYFDEGAVKICLADTFGDDRARCLDRMKGRVLDAATLERCRAKGTSADRRECIFERSVRIGDKLPRLLCEEGTGRRLVK